MDYENRETPVNGEPANDGILPEEAYHPLVPSDHERAEILLPETGPRPAVFFDLDGTWFRWQLFDEWIRAMIREGLLPELVYSLAKKERQAYQDREGPFSAWVWKQVAAYSGDKRMAGIKVGDAKFVAHRVIEEKGRRVHVFTRNLSEAAKEAGYHRAIISGSPREVVAAFAEANGISIFLGTEFEEGEGRYTGVVKKEWVNDKTEAVKYQTKLYDIDLPKSVAIGDSFGDHKMLELVGFPICFNPEKKLRDLALERGWLIVVEKKDCLHMYLRRPGDDCPRVVGLDDYLPAVIARNLKQRGA
jgi:HAD superfamily hydrolase (TIGR01490 family)